MKKLSVFVMVLGLCVSGYGDTIAAFTSITDGDTGTANPVMDNFNLVRDEVNGSLSNVNFASDAGVVESKLDLSALAVSNLVKSGDMESWLAGASAQPAEWTAVSTPVVARDTAQQGNGSYALKITGTGAADEGSSQTITNLKISTVYRLSARVKVTSGDTASITTTGATTNMDENSTSTSWATVTGTFTTNGSGTDVVVQLLAQNDTDIVWFDSVIVTEGTAKVGWTQHHGTFRQVLRINLSSTTPVAVFRQGNATNGYGLKILGGGTASGRYVFSVESEDDSTDYLRVTTETGKVGSVFLPEVYSDDIGTERDLLIQADGRIGYDSSSERFKKNIKTAKKTDIDWVYDLRPVKFDKKNGKGTDMMGLIAEEVDTVQPKLVSYEREKVVIGQDEQGKNIIEYRLTNKPETVNYGSSFMIASLIKVIQLQKDEIDVLKDEVNVIKARLDALEGE